MTFYCCFLQEHQRKRQLLWQLLSEHVTFHTCPQCGLTISDADTCTGFSRSLGPNRHMASSSRSTCGQRNAPATPWLYGNLTSSGASSQFLCPEGLVVLGATTHVSAVTCEDLNTQTPEAGVARSWIRGSFCPHVSPLANGLSVSGPPTCSRYVPTCLRTCSPLLQRTSEASETRLLRRCPPPRAGHWPICGHLIPSRASLKTPGFFYD